MKPIFRATGATESERYLATLADRTFLDLWSYPNTFSDRKIRGKGDGKELCDLLVVFGDDVIIFSDKSISWPPHEDIMISWVRWYKRAIEKSVDQIRGAERWLQKFPDRVFVDKSCTQRLPIELAPSDRRRVHGVAIALGADEACKKHFGGDDGSLLILSALTGNHHKDQNAPYHQPFAIGDVDPDGPFVHVFDRAALDLVMSELDTASDFVRYLSLRSDAIRGGRILAAHNEGDLLAFYLQNDDGEGRHTFEHQEATPDTILSFGGALFDEYTALPQYKAKKEADKVSYVWDQLITTFSKHVLAGTSVAIMDTEPSAALAERALRMMASEGRTMRRALSHSILDAYQKAEKLGQDRYARIVLPMAGAADLECAYVFLLMGYPKNVHLENGYDQYRHVRASMLETYCYSVLHEHRNLKRAVGIAMDGSNKTSEGRGGSEDLMAIEITEWTDQLSADVQERRKFHEVLVPSRLQYGRHQTQEYPPASEKPTRQQRRAAERQAKKTRK